MPRPEPLTQSELDQQGCDTPNCGHDHTVLFLSATCHPRAGLQVSYSKATGVLTCACRTCKATVGEIRVAP